MTAPAPIRSAPRRREPRGARRAQPGRRRRRRGRGHICGRPAAAAGAALAQSAGTLWNVDGRIVASTESGMPICATSVSPQCEPARQQQMARLQAEERDRPRRADGDARTSPVRPSMPLGRSTASTGAPPAFTASTSARRLAFERARKPGAEQRVDDETGGKIGRRAESSRPARHSRRPPARRRPSALARSPSSATRTSRPCRAKQRGGDEAVAAIVARPGDDQDRRPPPAMSRAASATAAPAFCISVEARTSRPRRRAGRPRPSRPESEARASAISDSSFRQMLNS